MRTRLTKTLRAGKEWKSGGGPWIDIAPPSCGKASVSHVGLVHYTAWLWHGMGPACLLGASWAGRQGHEVLYKPEVPRQVHYAAQELGVGGRY